MKVTCPRCGEPVPPVDVSVRKACAYCRNCEETFPLEAPPGGDDSTPPRSREPPDTKVVLERDGEDHLALYLPSLGFGRAGRFFAVFALAWNVGVWACIITELSSGRWGLGALVFLAFMSIFIIAGLALAGVACWIVYGRTAVAMDRRKMLVQRLLFRYRIQREYPIEDIEAIRMTEAYEHNHTPVYGVGIHLEGHKVPFVFGSSLADDEKEWLLGEIHDFWSSAVRDPSNGSGGPTTEGQA